jgi:ribosomal protein S18 acetylase RimI-like enzyme
VRQHADMPLNIRQAVGDDLKAIEGIIRRAYSHYVSRIGREPGPMSDNYKSLIEAGLVHVVEREHAIQGILVLIPERDAMLLDNVAVDPRAQGSGLGRRLLQYAEEAARAAGYQSVRLYTNEAMTENLSLYSRIGYTETHRAEEKGLKRVYMVKALT